MKSVRILLIFEIGFAASFALAKGPDGPQRGGQGPHGGGGAPHVQRGGAGAPHMQQPRVQSNVPRVQQNIPRQSQTPRIQPPNPGRGNPGFNPGRSGNHPRLNPGRPGNQPGLNPGLNPGRPGNHPGLNPGRPGNQPGFNPGRPGVGPNRPNRPDVPIHVPVHNPHPGSRPNGYVPVPVGRPGHVPPNVRPYPVRCVPDRLPAHYRNYRPPMVQNNFCAPIYGRYTGRYNPPLRNSLFNTGFWFGGTCYSAAPFFSYGNYCPTSWFYFGNDCWFRPGSGYYYSPPVGFNDTITVVVEETYTEMEVDQFLGIEVPVTKTVTWYYNAYYDADTGCYGYTDCNGLFHWLQW